MRTTILKSAVALLALAAAGFVASAEAQPYYGGGGYDRPRYDDRDDRYGPPPGYGYRRPYYDDRDDYRYYRPRPQRPSDGCLATIRATGVGNIFPGVARLNATLAWRREVQAVYGFNASWASARNKSITCSGTRCTASGRPCRH
jgi:hypothetical protein